MSDFKEAENMKVPAAGVAVAVTAGVMFRPFPKHPVVLDFFLLFHFMRVS